MPTIYPHSPPRRFRTDLCYGEEFIDYAEGDTPDEARCGAQQRYERLRRLCGPSFLDRYPHPEAWNLRTYDRRPSPVTGGGCGCGGECERVNGCG